MSQNTLATASPFEGDPRRVLERAFRKADEKGYAMNVGPKLEYFYFTDSVHLEPTITLTEGTTWSLSLRIGHGNTSYVLKNI